MRYQTIRLSIPMNGHTLPALLLMPEKRPSAPVPGVLWLHGGGYMTGMAEMAHFTRARDLAGRCGAVVLAPGGTGSPSGTPIRRRWRTPGGRLNSLSGTPARWG